MTVRLAAFAITGRVIRAAHYWKSSARTASFRPRCFGRLPHSTWPSPHGQTLEHAYRGRVGRLFRDGDYGRPRAGHAGPGSSPPGRLFTNNSVREATAESAPAQPPRLADGAHPGNHGPVDALHVLPLDQLMRLEASNLPFGASLIAGSAVATTPSSAPSSTTAGRGHPVSLVVVPNPAGAQRVLTRKPSRYTSSLQLDRN